MAARKPAAQANLERQLAMPNRATAEIAPAPGVRLDNELTGLQCALEALDEQIALLTGELNCVSFPPEITDAGPGTAMEHLPHSLGRVRDFRAHAERLVAFVSDARMRLAL
jgi:hypothetical protein